MAAGHLQGVAIHGGLPIAHTAGSSVETMKETHPPQRI